MSRTIVMRATSLAASTGLLALAIGGAFSLTYTVSQWIAQDPPMVTVEPAPLKPAPNVPHPTAHPRPHPTNTDEAAKPSLAPNPGPDKAPAAPTPAGPPMVTNPRWLQTPHDLARYYPARALQAEVEGSATLDCAVDAGGRLACNVVSETPANWGFGQAAIRISEDYRMAPALRDGQAVAARYRMRVPFQLH